MMMNPVALALALALGVPGVTFHGSRVRVTHHSPLLPAVGRSIMACTASGARVIRSDHGRDLSSGFAAARVARPGLVGTFIRDQVK